VGPLVSLALAGLFFLLSTATLLEPASRSVAGYLALINLSPEEREATSVQAAMKPVSEAVVVRPQTPLRGALAHGGRPRPGARARERAPGGLLTLSTVMWHLRVREALGA
jgi:hypothetical protein